MSAIPQKRQLQHPEKDEKSSKENVSQNIPQDGGQSKKPKNMPDFARLHESLNKQQEKLKLAKKAPTIPHEFSLSATNRKVDHQSKPLAPQSAHATFAQAASAQRQTLMALPSVQLTTPSADQRTSRPPGMTQLLPLRLPPIQPPLEVTNSSPEAFTSFLPPPLPFQPSAAPSSTGGYTVAWAQQMSYAPQYIPPPDWNPASSPARQYSNSMTPKRTPGSHHGQHHVSFADASQFDPPALPPQSPLSRGASSVPQSPVHSDIPAAELTVDLEAGGIVRERDHPVTPSPLATRFVSQSTQRPILPYPSPILHHPVQQHTAQTFSHHQSAYTAQQYHAHHEEFRADVKSLHAILNTTDPSREAITEPPKRRETALGPPLRIPVKPKPQPPIKVDLTVEKSPARTELAKRLGRDLSDSNYTPSRSGPVSRLTFTAGSNTQPLVTPNRSSALPTSYGATPQQQQHSTYSASAVSTAPSPRVATQPVSSINGVTHLPANSLVALTPRTMNNINNAARGYQQRDFN